jgi:hypothetical protein
MIEADMRLSKIPIEDPQWFEFVSGHPAASPFHLPAWATVITECYKFEAFVLTVQDTDGEILAGIPVVAVRSPLGRTRWVSLPFSDCCPVLQRPGAAEEEILSVLTEYVLQSGTQELEIRSALPAGDGSYPVEVGYHHVLDLPQDPADLHPHKNYRQHRNQAMRKGVQVTRGTTSEDMDAYYRLQTLTRRRLGVPVQPKRFFDLISRQLVERGNGFVATATLDGEPLAACVYLTHNATIVAKFQASDPDQAETGAGHLIHWEVMSAACTEGYHSLDMGRTDLGAEGLRVYKTRLGATESPLFYTHIGRTPPEEKRPRVGGLPQRIIRNSPIWVCRAAGEVLYRWTA